MKPGLSILDTTSEEVRHVINAILGSDFSLRFAETYEREEQLALASQSEFIWVGWPPVDGEMIRIAPNLKVIHKCGIGVDDIDIETARKRGIRVFITSGINSVPVSEMALLMMLSLLRKLSKADRSIKEGKWLKTEMRGESQHLTSKSIGIIGMGNIGKNLAKLLLGFECSVKYYDVNKLPFETEKQLQVQYSDLNHIIQSSDVVSLHLPFNQHTRYLFKYDEFKKMKKGAIFINCARGELVKEEDLIRALEEKIIAGAGLDVFENEPLSPESPLTRLDNVLLTPHIAGSTINNMHLRAQKILDNLRKFQIGENINPNDIIV